MILQAVKTQKTTNYKYSNWKLEYIAACLTNTEFGVCGSDRKTFTALSWAKCICQQCCYNQKSQSTYPIHTHIPNNSISFRCWPSHFRTMCLISTPFKTFHSTEYFTLSMELSVLCPWSQPDAFPLLAVHNCLIHTYTAIWKPALQSKLQNIKHCSNKGSLIQQFFKYDYFSYQDDWCK